jgi:DNA-binding FrmR family transcriptional regulator
MDEKDMKKDIVVRLRRIEGQVKGIEKMVESEACCRDVLVQVAAIRAAINKVGGLVLENYAKSCMLKDGNAEDEDIEKLVSTLLMFIK